MTATPVLALDPRDDEDEEQRPETDAIPQWPYFAGVRVSPHHHLKHAGHGWRD